MTTAQQSTKSKGTEIARNFAALRGKGHSTAEAISIIAKDSDTDSDTILVAIHYALTA